MTPFLTHGVVLDKNR